MTFKTAIFTVLLAIVVAGGGMTSYIFFVKNKNEQISTKQAVDPPLSSFVPETADNTKSSSSDLSVKSAQDSANTSSNALPDPSQFSVYEQYANAGSTQYIDVLVGNGDEATKGSTAYVVYKGYLTDGTIFDQTKTNELGQLVAFNFTLGGGQVIQGWEQGIAGMKVGGKRRLIIPSQFGYGSQGAANGAIPPNSLLIFDVELAKVDPPQSQ